MVIKRRMKTMGWPELGKKRNGFGIWADKKGVKQIEVERVCGLSRGTVSKLFNDNNYDPSVVTYVKLQKGLLKLGYRINRRDFW
jgi:hypothetical protein